ncbi:MAG: TonB-dependent receptor [Brumimicrobium sp.]|nr:TonB-dependent receptor [Brumimicrobium sp.]
MKTRNVIRACAVALLLPLNLFSQFQISGTVRSQEGELLEGVTVKIRGENKGTLTNEEGKYVLQAIKTGKYELEANFLGFEGNKQSIDLSQDMVIDFSLVPTYSLLEGIEVKAIRAAKNSPTTYSNLDKEAIEKQNYGQDIPFLLSSVPSTIVTSDAGAGIGYTGFRIRGVDPTRTNITIDGIPINDAESQTVFWVNMPDMSSSVESMQVQRGVGTSTNGAGAFGASINISTQKIERDPYAIIDNSGGSFNTLRNAVKVGTGLIQDKFSVDARLSRIVSDGYIDRANSNLQSFYLSGTYLGNKSTLKLIVFGGKEKTYQAWYGTPESRIKNDQQGMLDYAARNGLDDAETQNLLHSGRTYNAYTYDNETDNYQQTHYQVHYGYQFNKNWDLKLALHYTRGKGYYENYRRNDKLATYNMDPVIMGTDTIKKMNLIRRKGLDNHFGGGVFSVNYKNEKGLDFLIGGAFNRYDGDHIGTVVWGQYMPVAQKDHLYYKNHSTKYDGNLFVKVNYTIKKVNIFTDIQYRTIDYSFMGIDDYGGNIIDMQQRVSYHFLNPKAGLYYQINNNHAIYASYAIANREPVRDDFKESTPQNYPKAETLHDLEVGYHLTYKKAYLNTNIYYMRYKNQLILTGEINDVGGYTRTNVKDSYRLGFELEGGYTFFNKLSVSANLGLSQNKILNFIEYIDSYDASWNPLPQTKVMYGTTDIAFSPNVIAGLNIGYEPIKGLVFTLMNQYVGKQFLDNTSNNTRKIDAYFITHLDISYSFSVWKIKEITVGGRINNLLNQFYQNNGYTFSYLVGDDRIQENFYYPQAGIHFLARLVIKL